MILDFSHEISLRVRYSETDRMGYCYHGNYATYFEIGRVEALRAIGIVYKSLEDQGILLPVASLEINYKLPAKYDDLLRLRTSLTGIGGCTMLFEYHLYNQDEVLLTTGKSTLVFVNSTSAKPMRIPEQVLLQLLPYEINAQ